MCPPCLSMQRLSNFDKENGPSSFIARNSFSYCHSRRPDGQRYRNKQQLVKALGKFVDLTAFDFRTGKINPALVRKSKQNKQKGYPIYEYLRGLKPEACLVPPIRQTASIFKQPVTLISNRTESTTKHDTKHGVQEKKSKQVRLERFSSDNEWRACLNATAVFEGYSRRLTSSMIQELKLLHTFSVILGAASAGS